FVFLECLSMVLFPSIILGGQRQRIAIALDAESEKQVQLAINNVAKGKSLFSLKLNQI
ncbi:unnamed protein product, partial [Rotaria sp. Silwood1]